MRDGSFMPNIFRQLARTLIRGRHEAPRAQPGGAAPESDVAVLDADVFRELHATLGSDMERVRGVYTKFLDSTAKRIDELRHQTAAANRKTLHALKGSAGMVGATRLAALASRLQEETPAQNTLPGVIDAMENELAMFHGVLQAQLDAVSHRR